jgi:hypothetical protein
LQGARLPEGATAISVAAIDRQHIATRSSQDDSTSIDGRIL